MKTALLILTLAFANSAAAADLAILHPGSAEGGQGTFTTINDDTVVMEATRYETITYDTLHRDGFDDTYTAWSVTANGTTQTLHCAAFYVARPEWLFLDCVD